MPAAGEKPWQVFPDRISLTVRLTPKGGRDAFDGVVRLADGRCVLKARVRAAAVEGAANAALVKLIAQIVGVAPRAVAVTAGATARVKRIDIFGPGPALAAVLEKIVEVG